MFSVTNISMALCLGTVYYLVNTVSPFKCLYPSRPAREAVPRTTSQTWRWTDITPSRELIWSSCFDDFLCARLDVPLDWLEPSDEKRAIIAIIKLPASDFENYQGAVFTNPGGPGGSGVTNLKRIGKNIQEIVGKNHDIVSFDPRGVGASKPLANCWSSPQNRKIWSLQDVEVVDSHPGMVFDAFARSAALSAVCTSSMGVNQTSTEGYSDILSFVSTLSVARDMLEMMNKGGIEKLRYWGFSYGTYLGGVFASMWPEKVERLVSDGNVDYLEWASGSQIHFLDDTDTIMNSFYYYCHLAGPFKCALYSPTPKAIEARLNTVLEQLKKHPIMVAPIGPSDLPELVSYSSLKRLISATLYRAVVMFPELARVVAALEKGDGAPFLELVTSQGLRQPFSCDCQSCSGNDDPPEEYDDPLAEDAFRAIMCSDGDELTETAEEFAEYAAALQNRSKSAGAVNVLFRIGCAGWKTRPKWRFQGPFGGNTSHPILFIANKADNVTPLRSAQNNAMKFKDSVVLIQDSLGHTSLTAPSLCIGTHIRNYFQDGTLPPAHTVCKADIYPFDDIDDNYQSGGEDASMRRSLFDMMERTGSGIMARI